jgi:DNA-binding beta-propeller fold protein YncE
VLLGLTCLCLLPIAWVSLRSSPAAVTATGSFTTFDSGQVRPLALSPDGSRLFAANTPDGKLEIFNVGANGLTHALSIPVGLEPVAVAVRNPTEVWVVNHLSDSVSIVNLATTPPRVMRTLLLGDEPRDIVFAGPARARAFITCAHRGQNAPFDPQFQTPGLGRADVWVFDATNLGDGVGGTPLAIVTLFGDTPRALAASPDGSKVYAAVFASGNRTTTIHEAAVPDGSLPPPHDNAAGVPAPETGLIVGFDGAHWLDGVGTIWDGQVKFSLPDKDVFVLDANATPPVETAAFSGVGTTLFNMVVNPASGDVYVSNTESLNRVRFEGPGVHGGSTVRGHVAESRITILGSGGVTPRHINKHVNYALSPGPPSEAAKSVAIPLEMAITLDGATLYVAAFGSSKVAVYATSELVNDTFVPDTANQITVAGGGPTGLVLDEVRGRLYVLTRFDDAISVIDTAAKSEVAHLPLFNPEPRSVVNGRRFLDDAALTSGHGDSACASCHVFGDTDHLAWDLGDPDGAVLVNPNPFRLPLNGQGPAFHPMKGPMATQSLRGLAGSGPMHWRGDRTGGSDPGGDPLDEEAAFKKFSVAFGGLLGRGGPLTPGEMQSFTDFALQLTYPPNPLRNLDNTLTANQQLGANFFHFASSDPVVTCDTCHRLNQALGQFGTDGLSSVDGEPQTFKIPHLRNAYQKVGMFGMPDVPVILPGDNGDQGPQIRGFGFSHDGSIDTIVRFLRLLVFHFSTDPATAAVQRTAVADFLLAFDSNLAPIVGQQVTLTARNGAIVGPRVDLMIQRCSLVTPECDLVVKGNQNGEARGWRLASGQFLPDRSSEDSLTDAALRGLAAGAGQELTYTAMPPGSGARAGTDRDEDGFLDRDELDAGSDPANALSFPGDRDGDGSPDALDCAPADPAIHPGAAEVCDGVDNDCDPATPDGAQEAWLGSACDGADLDICDGGVEACTGGAKICTDDAKTENDICDGIDNDCDGTADNPSCLEYDVDGNGRIDGVDLSWFGRAFGQCDANPQAQWWYAVDYDHDGCVDGDDLVVLANLWGTACGGGVLRCR